MHFLGLYFASFQLLNFGSKILFLSYFLGHVLAILATDFSLFWFVSFISLVTVCFEVISKLIIFCDVMRVFWAFWGRFLTFLPFDCNFDVFGFRNWDPLVIMGGLASDLLKYVSRTPRLVGGGRTCHSSLLAMCSSLFGIWGRDWLLIDQFASHCRP